MTKQIEVDGRWGEGGGQILRTTLSLSALTGRSIHIVHIRGSRSNPGLKRQHLTCAKAVAELTGGTLSGAELNSEEMTFTPGKIRSGEYHFQIGSAGSTVLLAQTVLPCLLHAPEPSCVVLEGGTHAAHAPVFEFFDQVFLPCLRRMGADVTAQLDAVGFYPAGGGKITLNIQPVTAWKRLEIMERGKLLDARITALSSGIPDQIGSDEVAFCQKKLDSPEDFRLTTQTVNSPGPGNVLFAALQYEQITELFSVCGDYNISRYAVSRRVAALVNEYRACGAAAGRFLTDQLLLPMAIGAGGKFLAQSHTMHTETNRYVIQKFLDVEIGFENTGNGQYIIEVKK